MGKIKRCPECGAELVVSDACSVCDWEAPEAPAGAPAGVEFEPEIETGLEMPSRNANRAPKRFPFEKMEIGQSFFWPESQFWATKMAFDNCVRKEAKAAGLRASIRRTEKDGQPGERVWVVGKIEE